jgi:hypothetical protein
MAGMAIIVCICCVGMGRKKKMGREMTLLWLLVWLAWLLPYGTRLVNET